VWALVWRRGVGSQLARLDGTAWRIYTAKDFGAPGVDVSAGFVLDGEEVWAPSAEGVLHWDGHRWKCYREAVANGDGHARLEFDMPRLTGDDASLSIDAKTSDAEGHLRFSFRAKPKAPAAS